MDRRALLASAAALAACGGCDDRAGAATAPVTRPAPRLKALAPFPVGTCAHTGQLDDPVWLRLIDEHFSQLTPDWQMKMEVVLRLDGSCDFEKADQLAAFARERGLRLYCTTLIWYLQTHPWFEALADDRVAFAREYDRYIAAVMGRYAGQAVGWDVVNEAVSEDGRGLRDCIWSRGLGGVDAYIERAFEKAREADPRAVLFLNDYNLENNPVKGATYLKLVERLLKRGVPLGGLGIQSHLDIEIPAGRITAFMREAAAFGLPIHVSELDASLRREGRRPDLRGRSERLAQQTARVAELTAAFLALPPAQRFAFTTWGVRDRDSFLRRGARDDGRDSPLMFSDDGEANPMFHAVADALRG